MNAKIILGKSIKFVGALGVSAVVTDIIDKYLPEPETKLNKALYTIGVVIISGAVIAVVCKGFDDNIDTWLKI